MGSMEKMNVPYIFMTNLQQFLFIQKQSLYPGTAARIMTWPLTTAECFSGSNWAKLGLSRFFFPINWNLELTDTDTTYGMLVQNKQVKQIK